MTNLMSITDSSFDPEVLKSDIPVLTDFWAEWCGPCQVLEPLLAEIGTEYETQLKIVKMDLETNPNTASAYSVLNLPTLILFKNGQEVERIIGLVSKEKLLAKIRPNLDS